MLRFGPGSASFRYWAACFGLHLVEAERYVTMWLKQADFDGFEILIYRLAVQSSKLSDF